MSESLKCRCNCHQPSWSHAAHADCIECQHYLLDEMESASVATERRLRKEIEAADRTLSRCWGERLPPVLTILMAAAAWPVPAPMPNPFWPYSADDFEDPNGLASVRHG